MFKYQKIANKVRQLSEEKIKNVVLGQWYGNTIIVLMLFLLATDVCTLLIARINLNLGRISFVLVFLFCLFYLSTRKVGIGITENRLVIVIFRHWGFKEKRIYEVPLDKIRNITVNKFFTTIYLKVSFISDRGKLERKKLIFSTYYLGPGSTEYKTDSKIIYNELVNIQKVMDKGDF